MERSGGCTSRALYAITYTGKHVSFSGINAYPRPVQKPYPPFVIGGRSEGAYRRAYAAAGVSRLLMRLPTEGTLGDAERTIRDNAPR